MRITNCVPLAGQGVIARYGGLVAVTDGRGPGSDLLLSLVSETAAEGSDGSNLVIKAARAAFSSRRQAAWACAGVTADGGMAVLVHGHAAATVSVDDAPEVTLTVGDSMLPVSRTFTGATVTVILVIGGAAPPDERFWLGDGVVPGGGLAVTATRVTAAARMPSPARHRADSPRPDVPRPVQPRPNMPRPDAPRPVQPTALDLSAVSPASDPEPAPWDAARDWSASEQPAEQGDGHPPTLDTPEVGIPAASAQAEAVSAGDVLVDGVLCANGHFNDPDAWSCRQCGVAMERPPRHFDRRPRPSLGELILDDGTRIALNADYVLGREPTLDGDVLAGRALPVRINDPNGTVSRLHLKVSLTGWHVEVSDLGSANGSVIQTPGEERTLTPFEPTAVEPGARIGIGHRSMQYVVYQGARDHE